MREGVEPRTECLFFAHRILYGQYLTNFYCIAFGNAQPLSTFAGVFNIPLRNQSFFSPTNSIVECRDYKRFCLDYV
jgi:hypothetical protein